MILQKKAHVVLIDEKPDCGGRPIHDRTVVAPGYHITAPHQDTKWLPRPAMVKTPSQQQIDLAEAVEAATVVDVPFPSPTEGKQYPRLVTTMAGIRTRW